MQFTEWLSQNASGGMALVAGAPNDAVTDWIVAQSIPRLIVLADRPAIAIVKLDLALRNAKHVEARIARGLSKDLDGLTSERAPGAIFIPASFADAEIDFEIKRTREQIAILGGYAPPPALTADVVKRRLAAWLALFAARRAGPLVMHLENPEIRLGLPPDWQRFEWRGGTLVSVAARADRQPVPQLAPATRDEVLQHAEFLAKTDAATLARMHQPISGIGARMVLEYWHRGLEAAMGARGHELFVKLALERINELARQLDARGELL